MADVREQGYKGFAYIKGNDKPYVTYGNSSQEIINRLQGFNRARSQQMQYATVNIGQLDMEQNKYMKYQKYDVATGKNITPIYLQLPSLPKEEFKMLTTQLKEDGAKFNGYKKTWYVTPDLKDKFSKYISEPNQQTSGEIKNVKEILAENDTQNNLADQILEWHPKHDMIGFEDTITIHLEDNQKVSIDASKLPQEYWTGNPLEKLKILDAVLDEVEVLPSKNEMLSEMKQDHVRVVDKAEYVISLPKNIENNECTVFFKDGRDPLHLYGDQFGVSLPGIPEEESVELIENYLLNQSENRSATEQERLDIEKGNEIKGFLLKEIDGEAVFTSFHADVYDSDGLKVMLHYKDMPEDSAYEIVNNNQIFSAKQKDAAEPILKIGSIYEIKMICNAEYSPAQLEEMVSGFRDGLDISQINLYANPQIPAWQMDMYRIGLQHGIHAERIATLCEQSSDWIGARKAMTDVIKEHRLELAEQITKAGFKAAPETVRKLEQINHLTGRENTMKDICKAFKEHTYKDMPKIDELVKDIGREFQMQEVAAMQQPIR